MRHRIVALVGSGAATLSGFVRFLARPSLDVAPPPGSRPVAGAWLLAFTYAATAVFALAALPLVLAAGVSLDGGLAAPMDRPLVSLLVAIVVLGPLVEEIAFRGWLKGTVGAGLGTALFLALWFGASGWLARSASSPASDLMLVALAGLGVVTFVLAVRLAGNIAIPGFRALFPLLFWLQGLVFGVLHVANFNSPSLVLIALIACPYIVVGWVWGYARLALGLPAVCILHMVYNLAPAIALVALSRLPLLD